LLIALGTRLGYQSTGFNTQEFLPRGKIIHVDIDSSELDKGHPKIELGISEDAVEVASEIFTKFEKPKESWLEWLQFARFIKSKVPVVDPLNSCDAEYVEIFQFIHKISGFIEKNDLIVAGSSGSGSTVTMQTIQQKGLPQRIITNKGLASMGYGLPGAIGASFSPCNRVWLFEGDGSFTQNLQELGVIAQFNLNITILIISNNGYASIRSTQRNYFGGNYIGCDDSTGLHMPKLEEIAHAYGIRFLKVKVDDQFSSEMINEFNKKGPLIIEIPVDPDQTYFPKIQSKIDSKFGMISNPIHNMTPELSQADKVTLMPYLN
jgi:acetolactate synthase-1/2/3 large subunit